MVKTPVACRYLMQMGLGEQATCTAGTASTASSAAGQQLAARSAAWRQQAWWRHCGSAWPGLAWGRLAAAEALQRLPSCSAPCQHDLPSLLPTFAHPIVMPLKRNGGGKGAYMAQQSGGQAAGLCCEQANHPSLLR